MTVPGLRVIPDLLTPERQDMLLGWLASQPASRWGAVVFRGVVAKRQMMCFGWDYVTNSRSLTPAPKMPPPLVRLRDAAGEAFGIDTADMEQVIVNRYPAGSGIGPHTDARVFGPMVMGVSLGGVGRLRFTRKDHPGYTAVLGSGAGYLMQGACRHQWQHKLMPVKATRYALTYRALRKSDG